MFVCARCGTDNLEENKFCRECGEMLVQPSSVESQPQLSLQREPDTQASMRPQSQDKIEVAAGELLYQTFQLYETGKLDEALIRCKDALRLNPGSTSGHSLLGMIYERKSESAAAQGSDETARDYLFSAMRQFERVAELNRDSVVDAEKLREIRQKMQLRWNGPAERMTLQRALELSLQAIREVPRPVAAGGGAAFLALALLLLLWSRSTQPMSQIPLDSPPPAQATSRPVQEQAPPYYPPIAPPQAGPVPTPQFTSPEPQQQQPIVQPVPAQREDSAPSPTTNSAQREVLPQPVVPPPVRIAPRLMPELPGPTGVQPQRPEQAQTPEPPKAPAAREWRGFEFQEQGRELNRQGRTQDAIAAFKRAIEAYQEQIKAGHNVDSANSGIRTCEHYIKILESP